MPPHGITTVAHVLMGVRKTKLPDSTVAFEWVYPAHRIDYDAGIDIREDVFDALSGAAKCPAEPHWMNNPSAGFQRVCVVESDTVRDEIIDELTQRGISHSTTSISVSAAAKTAIEDNRLETNEEALRHLEANNIPP